MSEITASNWRNKLSIVDKQTKEMLDPVKAFVRCSCNKKLWPHQAYRCLYCGEWYCQKCAEIHFGKQLFNIELKTRLLMIQSLFVVVLKFYQVVVNVRVVMTAQLRECSWRCKLNTTINI